MLRPLTSKLLPSLLLFLLLATACLPTPQDALAVNLLTQLSDAQRQLVLRPADTADACSAAGDARTRLYGQPGVEQNRRPWSTLRRATDALVAACGQLELLAHPVQRGAVVEVARRGWWEGTDADLALACGALREVADELRRPPPTC